MKIRHFPCKILHVYVLITVLIYLMVQYLKYYDLTDNAFILYYLNDLIIMPLVLTSGLNTVWLIKNDKNIRLSVWVVFSVFAFYAFYFEYYLPEHNERYTADLYDVLCYGIGSVIFYFLQKLP